MRLLSINISTLDLHGLSIGIPVRVRRKLISMNSSYWDCLHIILKEFFFISTRKAGSDAKKEKILRGNNVIIMCYMGYSSK